MKLRTAVHASITAAILFLFSFSPVSSMDDPGFTIERMVVSEGIAAKEPIAIGDAFPGDTEKVYCFLEAVNIENDTTVDFVWYFGDKEMARVSLPLMKGRRWRTYSSKKTGGLQGNWKVELQSSAGIILNSVSFRIQ